MERRKLVNNIILFLVIFLFNSCQKKIDTQTLFNQDVNIKQIDEYSDDADVCKFESYKLENLDLNKFKEDYNINTLGQNFEPQKNWNIVQWSQKNISKQIQNFILPNFKLHIIDKILVENPNYYSTYTYQKGSNDEINAVLLYLFVPEKKTLFYYEIIQ